MESWYLVSMIGKSLDCLGHIKYYTQLDQTDAYHKKKTYKSNKLKIVFSNCNSSLKYQTIQFPGYVNKAVVWRLCVTIFEAILRASASSIKICYF